MGKLNQMLLEMVIFALFSFWILYELLDAMKQSGALVAIQ